MWPRITPYSKAIMALLTGAVGWATLVVTSDPAAITSEEWVAGGAALVTVVGVFLVPNRTAEV